MLKGKIESMFEYLENETQRPIRIYLNEKKFNNLIAITKGTKIKAALIEKYQRGEETIYFVEIGKPIELLEIALEKNNAYQEKLDYFSKIEEHLFI